MTSPMYGTDVMIGVATKDVDINRYESDFVSALGIDSNSWGSVLLYTNHIDILYYVFFFGADILSMARDYGGRIFLPQ